MFLGILYFINIVSGIFVILNKDFEREANPAKEIHVAFSNLAPLVIRNHNSMPDGLDVAIIENFAKRYQLTVKYFELNVSLNELFKKQGEKLAIKWFEVS